MYAISSFNKVITTEKGYRLCNTITKKSIGYDQKIELLFSEFCKQQLNKLEDNIEGKLLQIIVAELLSRGIIIPIDQVNKELDYLNSITPLQLPENGFFYSRTIDVNLIDLTKKLITFIGVPCDLGASRPGSRYGPKLLRAKSQNINFRGKNAAIFDIFKNKDFDTANILDLGDVTLISSPLNKWISKVKDLYNSLPSNTIPFMIGGDHTFTLAAVESLWETRPSFLLIHLDHHLDIQIWGEFENNKPTNLDLPCHGNFISWVKYNIPQLDIIQIGICRYQSIGNRKYLNQVVSYLDSISKKITDFEIQNQNVDCIFTQLPKGQNIYLSIDIDVINSLYIRENTGFPGHTGIDLVKFLQVIDFISSNNQLIGIDLMEYGISDKAESHNSSSTILINVILNILQSIN